jgi:hypothetical protein
MCDTRSNTIIDICRRGADAEYELTKALGELSKSYMLDSRKIREAVIARGGDEPLRFLDRALEMVKAREMVER